VARTRRRLCGRNRDHDLVQTRRPASPHECAFSKWIGVGAVRGGERSRHDATRRARASRSVTNGDRERRHSGRSGHYPSGRRRARRRESCVSLTVILCQRVGPEAQDLQQATVRRRSCAQRASSALAPGPRHEGYRVVRGSNAHINLARPKGSWSPLRSGRPGDRCGVARDVRGAAHTRIDRRWSRASWQGNAGTGAR
jgi:hypothetical protein